MLTSYFQCGLELCQKELLRAAAVSDAAEELGDLQSKQPDI